MMRKTMVCVINGLRNDSFGCGGKTGNGGTGSFHSENGLRRDGGRHL